MACMLDLPLELLTTIITFMVMSSDDMKDWARVTAVCKRLYAAAIQPNVLRVVNCEHVPAIARTAHQNINGLVSRCVQVGNPTADSAMAKVILFGGDPLWTRIKKNDEANSSIKSAITLPLADRRNIAKSLITGSIADVPYILFSMEDEPHLCESYQRLYPLRLMKSFITHAGPMDLRPVYNHLVKFIISLVGYPKYIESGIHELLGDMYRHERKMWLYEYRRIKNRNTDYLLLVFGREYCLPASAPKYREPVLLALDKLFEM